MSLNRILSQRPDVAWKEVDGQVILMDLSSHKRVHRLNSVGSFIWEKFDGKTSLKEILNLICNEFEVDEDTASTDLNILVKTLLEKGVLLGS